MHLSKAMKAIQQRMITTLEISDRFLEAVSKAPTAMLAQAIPVGTIITISNSRTSAPEMTTMTTMICGERSSKSETTGLWPLQRKPLWQLLPLSLLSSIAF